LPGVAIAVRAMEKFAIPGVDCVGIAYSQRAAATNRNTSNVGPGLVACWQLGSHCVAGLETSNGLGALAVAARQIVSLVRRLCAVARALIASAGCCRRRNPSPSTGGTDIAASMQDDGAYPFICGIRLRWQFKDEAGGVLARHRSRNYEEVRTPSRGVWKSPLRAMRSKTPGMNAGARRAVWSHRPICRSGTGAFAQAARKGWVRSEWADVMSGGRCMIATSRVLGLSKLPQRRSPEAEIPALQGGKR
jgi:hypothetical protein